MIEIKPIVTEQDYENALKAVEPYFDDESLLSEEDSAYFDAMITLIERFEETHYQIFAHNPIEAIKFRMEQQGLSPKDLVGIIGPRNRVYEVLNGKRNLTLPMIRNLHSKLGIPAEVLLIE